MILRKKTHKQIGNYLVRYYDNTTFEVFKQWKRKTAKIAKTQKIIERTIDHMRKQQMDGVKSAFKSFIT
jgi:hypothetical protein